MSKLNVAVNVKQFSTLMRIKMVENDRRNGLRQVIKIKARSLKG